MLLLVRIEDGAEVLVHSAELNTPVTALGWSAGRQSACLCVRGQRGWCRRSGLESAKLDQHRSAIDNDHLAGAEILAHQVEIGFGDIVHLADASDRQPCAGIPIHRLAIMFAHRAPKWRADHAG